MEQMAKEAVNKIINEIGVNISYDNYTETGKDSYGQPQYTNTTYTLKAVIEALSLRDVKYVEAGFLPEHYLYLYFYPDDISFTINKTKDEISYNNTIYIIRNIFEFKVKDTVIYVKVLARRKEVK
jgi:hypothetical protein